MIENEAQTENAQQKSCQENVNRKIICHEEDLTLIQESLMFSGLR